MGSTGESVLRVITYNLHKGRSVGGRRDIVAEALAALAAREPDLLLCQEVFHGDHEPDWQAPRILQELGERYGHAFGPNAFRKQGCHGNATFSSLPILADTNRDISENRFERRGILHTRLDWYGRPLDVLNTHFSLTAGQRRRQWRKLVDCLPAEPEVPVLAAGDFNDWSTSLDRHARQSGLLENALWGLPRPARRTFPARQPRFSLDRVYLRNLEVASVEVLRGAPWCDLSDHLPVEVCIRPV